MVSKILAPLDCTEIAEAGLLWAEQAARRCGATLHLLTVIDLAEDGAEAKAKNAEAYLQSKRDRLKNTGLTVKMEVAVGPPAETIVERAEGVDLTVASSGTTRWLISAVLDRVLEKMTSPLVVVRASQSGEAVIPPTDKILVALDQADYSSEIIPIVMNLAKGLSSSVTLCHAVAPNIDQYGRPAPSRIGSADPLEQADLFIKRIAEQFEQEGIATETVVAIGDAPEQIVRTAQRAGAGLIALTTRGRDHLDSRLVGGTANAILHSTRIPCLLTRRLPAEAGSRTWAVSRQRGVASRFALRNRRGSQTAER